MVCNFTWGWTVDKIVKKCLWRNVSYFKNLSLEWWGWFELPGQKEFLSTSSQSEPCFLFSSLITSRLEKSFVAKQKFCVFYKTTKELNVLLLSSTFPKPAVARYQRLYCTSQESTRIQRYTKIHDNTKTKETQCYARKSTRIHEKTQKTEYNAWKMEQLARIPPNQQ